MARLHQQRGMSFFGIMIILLLVAFFTTLAIKITPLYIEYGIISSALDSLAEDELGRQGKAAMVRRLDAQIELEGVDSIRSKDIVFKRSKDSKLWIVTAAYEARSNIYGDIGIYINFNKTVKVPR